MQLKDHLCWPAHNLCPAVLPPAQLSYCGKVWIAAVNSSEKASEMQGPHVGMNVGVHTALPYATAKINAVIVRNIVEVETFPFYS